MAAPTKALRLLMRAKHNGLFRNPGLLRYLATGVQPHVAAVSGGDPALWQLCSAVCLERPAVVISDMNAIEQEYNDMLQTIQLERSHLADHEIRHRSDMAHADRRKAGDSDDLETEALEVTALEIEDGWEAELAKFTPASCTTAADESGDKSTHARLLQRKLTLLVRQTLGRQVHWVLPQGPRQEGETMREAAERVLEEKCGSEVKARFLGNAPVGFYKYKFQNTKEGEPVGVKVFFFKALLQGGDVQTQAEDVQEAAWVTREELGSMVLPGYRQRVYRFLLDL